jgi:hypothetical protein
MAEVTKIAEGVWRVAGDIRKAMNVFLIGGEGGVTPGPRAWSRRFAGLPTSAVG